MILSSTPSSPTFSLAAPAALGSAVARPRSARARASGAKRPGIAPPPPPPRPRGFPICPFADTHSLPRRTDPVPRSLQQKVGGGLGGGGLGDLLPLASVEDELVRQRNALEVKLNIKRKLLDLGLQHLRPPLPFRAAPTPCRGRCNRRLALRLFLRFTHLRSQCPDEVKRKIDALSYSNNAQAPWLPDFLRGHPFPSAPHRPRAEVAATEGWRWARRRRARWRWTAAETFPPGF